MILNEEAFREVRAKPLLVGEANPYYAGDDSYALFPLPIRASGHRLCTRIMNLGLREYLRNYDRVNLCKAKWKAKEARATAQGIRLGAGHARVVLCGQKVCGAFTIPYVPLSVFVDEQRRADMSPVHFLILPHPSALSRFWNEAGAYERARAFLTENGVL